VIRGLRLKIDDHKISQALTPSQRRPRSELIRVANSYFEGMEAGTDKNTPFDKGCQRIENGQITSNDPTSKSEITRMSCGEQFAKGFTKVITHVQERRFRWWMKNVGRPVGRPRSKDEVT
jgi:hypothetical protein